MTALFRELDTVVLIKDLPEAGFRAGDLGAVVHLYGDEAIEVESVTTSGRTQAGGKDPMNWTWLVLALPAGAAGLVIGAFLRRRWEDDEQVIRRAGRACVLVALAAWCAAFFHVVPLASNAIALGALSTRVGLYRARERPSSRAVSL